MSERLLVVGEALVDVVHRADGAVDEYAGGSPLNVAIGLARLGHHVEYAARFGRDAHGAILAEHLRHEEPLLSLVAGADAAQRTSTATATLDAAGAATYEFDLVWDVGEILDERPVAHLHSGSIAATLAPGADTVLGAARRVQQTGTFSYDPNVRPTLMGPPAQVRDRVETLVGLADVVKASDEDIAWLHGDRLYDEVALGEVMADWAGLGAGLVVVTRGDRGSLALLGATGERAQIPAGVVTVVDTVGAGDAYMAGLVSGLLDAGLLGGRQAREALRRARIDDIRPALRRATACGNVTVSRAGANPPTRADLPS